MNEEKTKEKNEEYWMKKDISNMTLNIIILVIFSILSLFVNRNIQILLISFGVFFNIFYLIVARPWEQTSEEKQDEKTRYSR